MLSLRVSQASARVSDAGDLAGRMARNVGRALEGKESIVELAVTALLAGGHLLVEDVPGVGKTTLARALARSVGVSFRRLQFTSDLMPADVVGGSVYDRSTGHFSFRPGPLFTHVLLADEINRTTPKTQSALLEAMAERQVSVDGTTHRIDAPFFVVATQNPEEFQGTYPLPESQLDRFLVRTGLGYPPPEVERRLLRGRRGNDPAEALEPVATRDEVLAAQRAVQEVAVADPVLDYLHDLVLETRRSPHLALGASTRAALALEGAVRARALVSGRDHALPDDVQALAVPVLAHRVRLPGHEGRTPPRSEAERALREVVSAIPVPV